MSTPLTFDPLGSNMEEVIAALPTQQERDEFTLFIEEHLKRGTGAGILRGMFLLLKANRCYLEKLPGQFNRELVQPIRDHALRMEKSSAIQIEAQKQTAIQNERTTTRAVGVMDRMESIVPQVDNVVQRSVDKVDTKALTQQISATLLESTVEPVRKTNQELLKMAGHLNDLIEKAKQALEILLAITWKKMFLSSLGISFFVWGVIFFFAYRGMQQSFDSSLQSVRAEQNQKLDDLSAWVGQTLGTGEDNRNVGERLSHLQVATDVKPLSDGTDHYAFSITNAYDAKVLPDGTGVIYFQGPDLSRLIEQEIEENKKLIHH
jgi:hypothetical protein